MAGSIFLVLIGFVLTLAIEFLIVLAFLRKNPAEIFYLCFLINLFSWPIANLVYGFYGGFYVIELVVILVESVLIMLLFRVGYWKALVVSFLANLVSAFVGKFFIP